MYEDHTQNYDPEIYDKYIIQCSLSLAKSFIAMYTVDYIIAINTTS